MNRINFRPENRGSLTKALSVDDQFQIIAPESPRPFEMLTGVKVEAENNGQLTADDIALHELLVSSAYEVDQTMIADNHTIPVSHALRFLGTDARRDTLKKSLIRLSSTTVSYASKKRRYENVPLLVSWLETEDDSDIIRFSLPSPIRELMRDLQSYAHIELAPLSTMKSKFSIKLYRMLAYAAARQKWSPDADNKVVLHTTPNELADKLEFPRLNGKVQFGKLKERVLDHIERDFSSIRRFATRVNLIQKSGRGRAIETIEFQLTIRPPQHYLTIRRFNMKDERLKVGGTDAKKYRVQSSLWLKAEKQFSKSLHMMHLQMFELWKIAIKEADEKIPLTDEYYSREFRGENLLSAIEKHGAEHAAWGLLSEEAVSADLKNLMYDYDRNLDIEAETARLKRIEIDKQNSVEIDTAVSVVE